MSTLASARYYLVGQIQRAAYWAHTCRKVYDLPVAMPSAITTEALHLFAGL